MKNLILNKLSLMTFSLVLGAITFTAQAHEFRDIGGGYVIGIGADVEPPIHGNANPNAIDFFATYTDNAGNEVFLDRTKGDKVDVVVVPLKFQSDNFNAPITQIFSPKINFTQTVIEEVPAYVSSTFIYPTAGAYGYYVFGEIKRKGKPSKTIGFVKFVCGNGTQDPGNSGFECVQ